MVDNYEILVPHEIACQNFKYRMSIDYKILENGAPLRNNFEWHLPNVATFL